MRNLRAYGLTLGDVEAQLAEIKGVHALRVAYDQTWLLLYSLEQQGQNPVRHAWDWSELRAHVSVPGLIDPSWQGELWEYFNRRSSTEASPFLVEVLIAPEFDFPEARQQIRRIELPPGPGVSRESAPRLQIITARPAALQHWRSLRAPAIWSEQTPQNIGSLGGYLIAPAVGLLATTAQHVLTPAGGPVSVAERASSAGRPLGHAVPIGPPTGDAVVDETGLIDVELHPPRPISGSHPAIELSPDYLHVGHPLRVRGAMSAHDDVYAWAFVRFATVGEWGGLGSIRVSDGFALRRTRDGVFGTQHERPTKPGDSGAWIIDPSFDSQHWVGTVVGGDGVSTIATFATNTLRSLSASNQNLRVAHDAEIQS